MITAEQRFDILCQSLTTRKLLLMYNRKRDWMEKHGNDTGDATFDSIRLQKEWEMRHCEQMLRTRTAEKATRDKIKAARLGARASRGHIEQRKAALSRLWTAFQGAFMAIRDDQENNPPHYRKHARDIALATKTFLDEFDALFSEQRPNLDDFDGEGAYQNACYDWDMKHGPAHADSKQP